MNDRTNDAVPHCPSIPDSLLNLLFSNDQYDGGRQLDQVATDPHKHFKSVGWLIFKLTNLR